MDDVYEPINPAFDLSDVRWDDPNARYLVTIPIEDDAVMEAQKLFDRRESIRILEQFGIPTSKPYPLGALRSKAGLIAYAKSSLAWIKGLYLASRSHGSYVDYYHFAGAVGTEYHQESEFHYFEVINPLSGVKSQKSLTDYHLGDPQSYNEHYVFTDRACAELFVFGQTTETSHA